MAGRYDIQTVKGDMLEVIFGYEDPTGQPIDLSGLRCYFHFKYNPTDPAPELILTDDEGGGILYVDPANGYAIDPTKGQVFIKVTKQQADLLNTPGGWYQCKLWSETDPDFEATLAFGEYKIYPEV